MIEDGTMAQFVDERYAGWSDAYWQSILGGNGSLDELADKVVNEGIEPEPRSGKQEYLENVINRFV
mgnify:CR=1 FL=1